MLSSLTVSLNCAGSGQRLGLGQTKALVDILGRPLIHWQLDLLEEVTDLRVVVGYNAPDVISTVTSRRPDAIFVINHDYAHTATGDSLLLAAEHAREKIFSFDGDLLIHPADVARLLKAETDLLGVTAVTTDDPICVAVDAVDGKRAQAFVRDVVTPWEWSGAAICGRDDLLESARHTTRPRHVYQLLESLLPIPVLAIKAREIDTSDDYARAISWMDDLVRNGEWP